ncbi:MAG TPA: hypothetical protein VMF14_13620 [Solirubrobacteraceae bacterium]|nr:hypothetical protein [Solirubrobacteraceae bacterium]
MNAVNLIPADRTKRSVSVSVSPVTLGIIGGLVVVLVAAVLYVFAYNDVKSRKSELATVTANAASWQAAANSYASFVTAAQQQKQQLTDIHQLITGRFPWSVLLSQIGGVMPKDAALSSLQATSPSSAAAASTTATTPATTGAPTTQTSQPIQIAGCAATESAVAATMVALGKVNGVSSVVLASTSGSPAKSSASSGSGSSSGSGGCPFPVTFSMSMILDSPSTGTSATGTTAAAATSTTPAATPAAATATTSATGNAQ